MESGATRFIRKRIDKICGFSFSKTDICFFHLMVQLLTVMKVT